MSCVSSAPRGRGRVPAAAFPRAHPSAFRTGLARLFTLLLRLGLLLGLLLAPGRAGAGESYPLGPEDQLRLKIYEWRASRDTIFEWTALNDVFTIGADGILSLPFAGRIPAEGLETGALADAIAESLARNMGLGQWPDVAVEVVRFRPFYILGDVARPGEYPYRPGLSVLNAVGVAGGLPVRADGLDRMDRELLAGQGDIEQLALTRISLMARRARLRAEAADAEAIAFPAELTGPEVNVAVDVAAGVLMEQERALFQARRNGLATRLRALEELSGFLEREIDSLGRQLGFLDQRIASMRKEFETVSTLVEKGIAAAPRQMELERALLQVQSDRLAAETGLLRARQEASRTELSILELRDERASEIAGDLRATELELGEVRGRAGTAAALLDESVTAALRLGRASRARPVYTITRPAGAGAAVEIRADEATEVRPGDTLRVELPLPVRPAAETFGSLADPAPPAEGAEPLVR